MTIHLPPRLEALIAEQVASGRYGSAAEVIEAALRLLDEREGKRRWLVAALAEGEEGEGIPYTPELMRQLRDEADDLIRRGVPSNPDGWP